MIYLMKNLRNGYTKIGRSNNPFRRERTLQSEEPEIELVALLWSQFDSTTAHYEDRQEERVLHELYAKRRIRGEWFDLSDTDIKVIVEAMKTSPFGAYLAWMPELQAPDTSGDESDRQPRSDDAVWQISRESQLRSGIDLVSILGMVRCGAGLARRPYV